MGTIIIIILNWTSVIPAKEQKKNKVSRSWHHLLFKDEGQIAEILRVYQLWL